MHELMACMASVLILCLFITQAAAGTNTFIEAAYCERKISEYTSEEYTEEEVPAATEELKDELEKMPGVMAEIKGDKLDIRLDGVIGPAEALGITDNSIHIEKDLKLKIRKEEDVQHDGIDGDSPYDDSSYQDADGDESDADILDVNN